MKFQVFTTTVVKNSASKKRRRGGESLNADSLPGFPCVLDCNNRLILQIVKNNYQVLIHLR